MAKAAPPSSRRASWNREIIPLPTARNPSSSPKFERSSPEPTATAARSAFDRSTAPFSRFTRLPGPAWIDLHPGFLMRGMGYFPIVGTVLGGTIAIALDCMIASIGLPVAAAATLAVGCGLHVTGCFHKDRLADSADGLGGDWSRSQVLKIMTDSRLGTFGVAALTLFLLAKVQLLDSLGASRWEPRFGAGGVVSSGAGLALLVSQTLSRLAAPYLIRTRDYVAEVGPKSPFYLFMVEAKHLVSWPRVALAAGHCLVVASALYGLGVAVTLVAAVLALAHLAGRKGEYLLGGVMGDFFGGTICVCEILVLALIVSRDAIVETCRVASDTILSAEGFFDPLRLAVALYGSDRLRPLVHFVLLLAVLKIWCTFVGPPDMYDREDDKIEKDEAEKKD